MAAAGRIAQVGPDGVVAVFIGERPAKHEQLLTAAVYVRREARTGLVADDAPQLDALSPLRLLRNREELANDDAPEAVRDERDAAIVERSIQDRLSLLDQLMHTVASPPVAYLLLVIGLGLLVFEFYSIGIGIAGVIGAIFLALGGYGVAALPFRTWALVLVILAFVAFSIDVQTAVPRAWTTIGMMLFVVGTLFFYPESDVSMSWIPITVAILGIAVVMYRGMPIMVRGRFATTAIPRDFLVDEIGTVTDPGDGETPATVQVRDSQWRGRADTALAVDDEIVVTGVDGLILEVAPRD